MLPDLKYLTFGDYVVPMSILKREIAKHILGYITEQVQNPSLLFSKKLILEEDNGTKNYPVYAATNSRQESAILVEYEGELALVVQDGKVNVGIAIGPEMVGFWVKSEAGWAKLSLHYIFVLAAIFEDMAAQGMLWAPMAQNGLYDDLIELVGKCNE